MIKNRILYLIILIIFLAMIILIGGKVPAAMFYLVVLLPIFSVLYLIVGVFFSKFEHYIENDIVLKGDKVKYIFMVKSNFFLLPFAAINYDKKHLMYNKVPKIQKFSVFPFAKRENEILLNANYRGLYYVGISNIECMDFLGIFKVKKNVINNCKVIVKPIINKIEYDSGFIKSDDENFVSQDNIENSYDIGDILKYNLGDNLKKIHWKMSAKKNTFLVKKYDSYKSNIIDIFLDLSENKYKDENKLLQEDKIIQSLVSVINYHMNNNVLTKISFFNKFLNQIECSNEKDFYNIYNILSEVSFDFKDNVKIVFEPAYKDNMNDINLFIFTTKLSNEFLNYLKSNTFKSNKISICYINNKDDFCIEVLS